MVCTIGPKSEKKEIMESLLNAGMNVMRLNFSHGDFEEHGGRITNLEAIMEETGKIFAVLLDTRGPEIRTGSLESGQDIQLVTGQKITITTDSTVVGNRDRISVTYEGLARDLKKDDTILLDDGLIGLKVLDTTDTEIFCEVLNNGTLGEKKGVNLPNTHISMPFLSEHDKGDLLFGIKRNVDYVAASFTRNRQDVLDIRNFLNENGGQDIKIIAKIENQEGIDNFEDILAVADGIMVARGDLGVEIPAQEVIFHQKHIIRRCNEIGKPVITATQMLDSMIKNPRPTRAEAGDVANAILDGTDAVMLSGESAKGKYPLEAVTTMATICTRTDREIHACTNGFRFSKEPSIAQAVSLAAVDASETLHTPLIVVATHRGFAPRAIRKYFPRAHILALTDNKKTARQLCLIRGVIPKLITHFDSTDDFFKVGKQAALESGLAQKGDKICLVSSAIINSKLTNTFSIQVIE